MSNYGRHDYRDPAREKFGKPGVSFPEGSLLHPTLTEVYDHRKDSTAGTLPYLTLSGNPRGQGCYLTRQSMGKGDDDSANLTAVYERLPGVVKTSYQVDETYRVGNKVQTQKVIAQDNPAWTGMRFSGEFALTALPAAGETVTVGAVSYKFVGVLTGAADEVLIAGTVAGTLFNLSSAINLDWGAGVNFGMGTVQNAEAVSWCALMTMVVADTNSPSAAVAVATTCAAGAWDAATTGMPMLIDTKEIDANLVYRVASRVTLPLPVLPGEQGVDMNRMLMRHISDTTKVTVKQVEVEPGAEVPSGFLITMSSVTPHSALTSMLDTQEVEAFDILTTRARSANADGVETVMTEEIVPPDAEPLPWTFGRLQSRVESVGALRSIRTTETLVPTGPGIGGAVSISGMSAQASHPAVAEAAAVGRPDELKGQAVVVFVTLKGGLKASPPLREELRRHVANAIGPIARPDDIRFAGALPKTRSGKIMRRLLKEIAAGKAVTGDTTALEDFAVLANLGLAED